MSRHFKLDQTLTPEELAALREFALTPGKTIDQCWEWVAAAGYTIHRSAVGTWVAAQRINSRFSASRETAEAVLAAARGGGVVSLTDAALATLSELLLNQLTQAQCAETIKTEDLANLSNALRRTIAAKEMVDALRQQQSEALAEAERAAKAGGSAGSVVSAIKRALGLEASADQGVAA